MNILSGNSNFFGLDIGTTGIRLVQLHSGPGPTKSVANYAYIPLEGNIGISDAKGDRQKLADSISQLVDKAQLSTRNVAVGLPSQKVFTTVADVHRLPPNELAKAMRYEIESLIPTSLNDSKVDWAVIGDSLKDKTKVEVLLSSVSNEFIEKQLDFLEGIGLNVIAFEPDTMAISRSLLLPGDPAAQMIIDIGSKSADLVIVMSDIPHLTRSIPIGLDSIVNAAAQNLSIDQSQAKQFILKFGLSRQKLEGQIYGAIIGVIDGLFTEIEKSIKFYQTRYPDTKISRLVVTGGASALPEFPVYLSNKFGIDIEIGNPWKNVSFDPARQNELLTIANHFSVAVGLAERTI